MEKWTSPRRMAGQEPLLLLVGAELHDGRTHAVEGQQRQGHAGPVGLLDEDHLVDRAPAVAAVLDGPADARASRRPPSAGWCPRSRGARRRAADAARPAKYARSSACSVELLVGQRQVHVGSPMGADVTNAGRRGVPSPAMTDSPAPTPPDVLFDVAGKTVVVTGGSRGIGRMIAGGFVAAGADVVIASRKADAVDATVAELVRLRARARAWPPTCRPRRGPGPSPRRSAADHDRVHVLVNNAGATWGAPLAEHDTASWDRVLDLNVQGVFHTTKFFLPLLEAASTADDPARVINIGSIDGIHVPVLESYSYSSSKAAVHQLTRHLARHLAPGITVNAVAPGPFESKMMAATLDAFGEQIAAVGPAQAHRPTRRHGRCGHLPGLAGRLLPDRGRSSRSTGASPPSADRPRPGRRTGDPALAENYHAGVVVLTTLGVVTGATARPEGRSMRQRREQGGRWIAGLAAAAVVAGCRSGRSPSAGTAGAAAPSPTGRSPRRWPTPSGWSPRPAASRPTACPSSAHRPARSTGRW